MEIIHKGLSFLFWARVLARGSRQVSFPEEVTTCYDSSREIRATGSGDRETPRYGAFGQVWSGAIHRRFPFFSFSLLLGGEKEKSKAAMNRRTPNQTCDGGSRAFRPFFKTS
jgi:hypothetical protein